ncbi:hypothetical protein DSO57_1006343 [Entomophthora muscae]|uniref:Uncharacterized protein n=1 Tax=Entomophthora muscae TaxID=34485 RepID=A0ACC2U5D6_9FUNG|nr:hypothetical protein DSO57_1006343 [Entomophthora muscae]
MGAKSKTKSRGRPSKTPTRTTQSSACPPPVVDVEGEPARSDPGMNEGPCPNPAGPKWHPATQLNSPSNLDHNQPESDSLQKTNRTTELSGIEPIPTTALDPTYPLAHQEGQKRVEPEKPGEQEDARGPLTPTSRYQFPKLKHWKVEEYHLQI